MNKRIWIRLVAWSALLIVVIVLKYLPFGDAREGPPPAIIDTTARLVIRQATEAEWEADLEALGRRKLGRQVTILSVRRGAGEGRNRDLIARGALLRYDPGDGPRLAYLAHPDEISDQRTAADVWRTLTQAVGFGQAFIVAGAMPPLTPEDLDRLPVDFQLDEGWTMLTAPAREPEASPAPASEGATTKDAKGAE